MTERETLKALDTLRVGFPAYIIWTTTLRDARAWYARGKDGHPWLIACDDLERFQARLRQN